jgi:hypothetical protein
MKDHCYAALFDKKDMPLMYKFARKVRQQMAYDKKHKIEHNAILTDEFLCNCEKKWNDHDPTFEVGNQQVQFLQVSKADDLAVDGGIQHYLNLILGVSSTRLQYVGKGTSTVAPVAGQTALQAEILPRVDIFQFGWSEVAGPSVRFAGLFGESVATITVNESGIFATPNAGAAMFTRNMFSNDPISHIVDYTGFMLASIVELVPKFA